MAEARRPAGYSGTPLVKKLGIRPGHRVLIAGAPADYDETLGPLPEGVTRVSSLRGPLDVVQFFVRDRASLERRFPALKAALARDGMLWVCWPKKASGVPSDLTGDVVRAVGLEHGLVDVKVAAIDAVWSGLKFVYRLADR